MPHIFLCENSDILLENSLSTAIESGTGVVLVLPGSGDAAISRSAGLLSEWIAHSPKQQAALLMCLVGVFMPELPQISQLARKRGDMSLVIAGCPEGDEGPASAEDIRIRICPSTGVERYPARADHTDALRVETIVFCAGQALSHSWTCFETHCGTDLVPPSARRVISALEKRISEGAPTQTHMERLNLLSRAFGYSSWHAAQGRGLGKRAREQRGS